MGEGLAYERSSCFTFVLPLLALAPVGSLTSPPRHSTFSLHASNYAHNQDIKLKGWSLARAGGVKQHRLVLDNEIRVLQCKSHTRT